MFQSQRDPGNPEVYVMNADGTNLTNLTKNPASDAEPNWGLGGGTKIVYMSQRNSNFRDEVYVMNPDGSGQTNLTNIPADDAYPAWSPNGKKIAFESDRSAPDNNTDIYVMNADSSNPIRLTNNTVDDYAPDWEPQLQVPCLDSKGGGKGGKGKQPNC